MIDDYSALKEKEQKQTYLLELTGEELALIRNLVRDEKKAHEKMLNDLISPETQKIYAMIYPGDLEKAYKTYKETVEDYKQVIKLCDSILEKPYITI